MYRKYIKNHIINKKNVILFIIFLLVGYAMMFTISIGITFLTLKNDLYANNLRFRSLVVNGDPEKYEKLKDIKHITHVEDIIYQNAIPIEVSEFDTDLHGEISLNALIDQKNIIITHGKMVENINEAICSDVFFPYEIEIINNHTIFDKSRLLTAKDIIDKSFEVINEDGEKYIFKIVGTYDANKNNNYLNSCYISKNTFKKIAPKYSGGTSTYNEETGEMVFVPTEYKGKLVIVDNYQNLTNVQKEIAKLNLLSQPSSELNNGYVLLLTIVPLFVSIIILLIFSLIFQSYLVKKINDRSKNYAILKAIGYNKKTIQNLDLIENILLFIISFAIAVVLYVITFNYLKNVYFAEYIYDGTILHFSILPIIIALILIFIFLLIVNKNILKKRLDHELSEILV